MKTIRKSYTKKLVELFITKPRTTTSIREKGIDKYANVQTIINKINTQATRCTSKNVYIFHKQK